LPDPAQPRHARAPSGGDGEGFNGNLGAEIKYNLLDPWALQAKRTLDLALTAVGGILISPFFLALCLLVYLESCRHVFHKDQRIGRGGKPFSCIQFRTMVPDAEALLQTDAQGKRRDEGGVLKILRAAPRSRATRVGRFLRKTSLNELPQIWNVLRGEMNLVAPRPYLPRECGDIGPPQNEILRVPPGITRPWHVTDRSESSFSDRVRMDAHYVRNWSVWLDLVILARTMKSVVPSGSFLARRRA